MKVFRDLLRDYRFFWGFWALALMIIFAALSLFSPYDPTIWGEVPRDMRPSAEFWLGTDSNGQDVFWMATFAVRNSLTIALIAGLVSRLIAIMVGMIAGYLGGMSDRVLMFVSDSLLVIPLFLMIVMLAMLIRDSMNVVSLGLLLAIFGWAWDARLIRSQILSLREQEFTKTAVLSGTGTLRLVLNEYMPYSTPLIFSTLINNMAWAIGSGNHAGNSWPAGRLDPDAGHDAILGDPISGGTLGPVVVGIDADCAINLPLRGPILAVGQRQRIPRPPPPNTTRRSRVNRMSEIILKTEGLQAFYVLDVYGKQKVVKAVNDVDLSIREDEIYGIAGESGCGKSTLLKALAAAVEPPLHIMGGRITYRIADADVDVTELSAEEKRRLRLEYIAYVPQGSMSVLNPVARIRDTYRDFIESHISIQQKDAAFELAKDHIVELGLPPKILDAYPHQLSGGMRQRVTIALATLLKPRIIIGDEPTTALDVVVQRGVVQLLKDVQSKLQNTIILVTHDMGVHANIADRIGIMYAGKIVEEGPADKIFGEPAHPYTQYLINSLPKFGDKTPRESVPGSPPSLANLPPGCPFHPRCPYVKEICKQQMPEFTQVDSNHKAACWLLGEGQHGQAA